jgi:Family of unknown function (DUF6152)
MNLKLGVFSAVGGLLVALPISAHHSFMAEFDQRKPVTLTGSVTGVEWQNPHTYFYLDVKDENGKVVNWRLETGSPGALMLRGWTRETIRVGDHLVVQGYRAKEIQNVAAARSVTMTDGRTIFGGQTDDGGPTR